jgi:hypothetical protein
MWIAMYVGGLLGAHTGGKARAVGRGMDDDREERERGLGEEKLTQRGRPFRTRSAPSLTPTHNVCVTSPARHDACVLGAQKV